MKKKNIAKVDFTKKNISQSPLKEAAFPKKNILTILLQGLSTLIFLVIVSYILAPSFPAQVRNVVIGDIASKDIKASENYLVEDKISTEKNRREAIQNSLRVYDYNPNIIAKINKKISFAFSIIQKLYKESYPDIYEKFNEVNKFLSVSEEVLSIEEREFFRKLKGEVDKQFFSIENNSFFTDKVAAFKTALEVDLPKKSLKTLKWHHYNPKIVKQIQYLLNSVMDRGVVSSKKTLSLKNKKGILIRDINSGKENIEKNIFKIKDTREAEASLVQEINQTVNKDHKALQRVILQICKVFIQPNLTFNSSETELRKKIAAEKVKPVFFQIKEGEMIVREGEKISQEHLIKLGGLSIKRNLHSAAISTVGLFVFVSLAGFLFWSYLKRFKSIIADKKSNIVLMSVILLCNMIICKLFISISPTLSDYTGLIETQSYYYAVPYAAGPMLVAILFGVDIGIIFSIITFIFTGLMLGGQTYYALFALTGSLFVVFRESQYVGRLSILGAGFLISLVNVITIITIHLISASSFSIQFVSDVSMGFIGGIIAATVVSSLLPLLEYFFRVTSDIKLLELSNLNNNLLREMLIRAPGTYQHSMVVGSLAEEAAKSVNANYLLARVGSYYHDIGKTIKSEYFIENLMGGVNKHDNLNPNMSSLIIISHVKDGIDLAKKYKLQPGLADFILEHHGTELIRYFYTKAKGNEAQELHSVKEDHFRYPGPKPQSKETAIVMLADSLEAASRTLTDPTPSRI
ncbi:MAG: HDIG domain-containing protein, partial [Nitrospinota bacterium]|nr:HDIG domain-containing protein [Nitrospinota bacterium]